MKLTQGTFSFLPELSDAQINKQIAYCLAQGWAVNIEHTDSPHPRNTYWEMWGLPLFDLRDPVGILAEINDCRRTFPEHYVRVSAFDASHGWESLRLSFIVNRPLQEARFRLERQTGPGRLLRYTLTAD